MDRPSDDHARVPRALPLAAIAIAVAFAGASCATLRPPGRNGGGAQSREGVAIAVARQQCTQVSEPDWPGQDLTEEILEIELRNAAPAPLLVNREAFRLVTPAGFPLRTVTWRAADPLPVGAGETRTMQLRFMTRGDLKCDREMRLDPDGGVRLAGHAISIGRVAFVPRPSSS